jgi:hypothetical protein
MFRLGLSGVLDGHEVHTPEISFSSPDGAMNIATDDFMQSDCERMVIIDTDIIFSPADVAMLLSHNEDFVSGLYPQKRPGLYWPVELLGEQEAFAKNPFAEGVNPLVKVKRAPKGFVNIHRRVFGKVATVSETYWNPQTQRNQPVYWKTLPGGHSEDFQLCDTWRGLGGDVFVDQRILLKHEGNIIYPIEGTYPNASAA